MHQEQTPARQRAATRDGPRQPGEDGAAVFRAALADFEAGRDVQRLIRDGIVVEDIPAPRRLAPYAAAIAATVDRDGTEVAWGRLVLLCDPRGQRGWVGPYRLVTYVRAEVEPEIAADPLLCQVCWSWLIEALDARTPGYAAPSGTVSRVTTEAFGGKDDEPPSSGCELRASWSPALTAPAGVAADRLAEPGPAAHAVDLDLASHVTAWCDSLSAAAGLPPAPGVATLPDPSRGNGSTCTQHSRRRR